MRALSTASRLPGAILFWALPFLGQNSQVLTLDDCVRLAENAPSAMTQAQEQALIAHYGVAQARTNYLPGLSVGNAFTYNHPAPNGSLFVSLNGLREYQSVLQSSLEIDTSGRLRAELARARADAVAATANLTISRRSLRRLVTASFYRLLLARKLITVDGEALAEAERFEERTKKLFANGEAAQADVIKAGADAALLRQTLQVARAEAELANHELASYWTSDVTTELNLDDVLEREPPAPTPNETDRPFMRRPEFALYDAQRAGFLADSRRARADLLPQAGGEFQWGIDSNRYSFADRGYAAIVHLNVPVFDWFKARNAVRQFRIEADQVSAQREIGERAFSREYQDAVTSVRSDYEQMATLEQEVRLSAENLRLAQIRYQGGEGLALDVVSAQNQLAQARSTFYAARAAYWNARADLEVASGR